MKHIILIISLLTICSIAQAQKEEFTVGFRGGYNWGPTISVSDGYRGVKGLLSFREHGLQATALYTISKPIENRYRFDIFFYYGVGAHTGILREKKPYYDNCDGSDWCSDYYRKVYPVVGFDGLVGAEYRFYSVPITVAIDFKPYFEFFGEKFFSINLYDFGLTVKYRIN